MMVNRVCIVGSGNWGSAIAKLIGHNVLGLPKVFASEVRMWVFEELIKQNDKTRKLTEIINEEHENVKYLPGQILPDNVIAVPDVVEAASNADILVFVLPHQFVRASLRPLEGRLKKGAMGVSLIKGFDLVSSSSKEQKSNLGLRLMSETISEQLDIPVSVLMGANLASQVAEGQFCESTIGCRLPSADADLSRVGGLLKSLFETSNFRIVVTPDFRTVDMCGALKNVVAVGAGIVDGLNFGDNTKAAIIRLGLMEMIAFAEQFYPGSELATFFESCGVADLITTCYGGRNRRLSEAFVKSDKSFEQLEKEMLNGQRLQGPETAAEVNAMLKDKGLEARFPLFTAVHKICVRQMEPKMLIEELRKHPEHMTIIKSHLPEDEK